MLAAQTLPWKKSGTATRELGTVVTAALTAPAIEGHDKCVEVEQRSPSRGLQLRVRSARSDVAQSLP